MAGFARANAYVTRAISLFAHGKRGDRQLKIGNSILNAIHCQIVAGSFTSFPFPPVCARGKAHSAFLLLAASSTDRRINETYRMECERRSDAEADGNWTMCDMS